MDASGCKKGDRKTLPALQASKTQDQINHADAPGLLHGDND